jgi:protein TonB
MPLAMPLAASAVAHLGIVYVVSGHPQWPAARPAAAQPHVSDVSDVQIPVEITTSAAAEPASALPARGNAITTHPQPTKRIPAPLPPTKRISVEAPPMAPNRGILKSAPLSDPEGAMNRAPTTTQFAGAQHAAPLPQRADGAANHGVDDEVVPEAGVSVSARLISGSPSFYPSQAREAEIEADVPLEIIVDQQGRVTAARAIQHVGYGLDDAAMRSVRAYRFSPAMRSGHPVRVKMRWVVQFRLR